MRIIKFLLSGLLIIGVLGGFVFFIGREVLLLLGVSELKQSVSALRQISTNAGTYYQECRRKGAADGPDVLGSIQLRFLSEKQYVVEVVCSQFQLDPIVITTKELPFLVTKQSGQSGIIWGEALSGIALEVFGRSTAVWVENSEVKTGNPAELEVSIGPLSSCQGLGYQCCPSDTSVGNGTQYTAVSDCPKTCFSACVERPTVLSFITQPFFDTKTRVLEIGSGEQVEFTYTARMGEVKTGMVSIDFGDGQRADLELPKGSSTHTYTCSSSRCEYKAVLKLVDANGLEAVQADLNSVTVVVTSSPVL